VGRSKVPRRAGLMRSVARLGKPLDRIAALLVVLAVGIASVAAASPQSAGRAAMAPGCRGGDPLAGVHHPARLEVLKPCLAVTGTVTWARVFGDGDHKFNLRLDPPDEYLLNERNRSDQGGTLVCEIVPADQPGCTPGKRVMVPLGIFQSIEEWFQGKYDFGICTGANVVMPAAGARVTVVGPYALDRPHGWAEIHPVWSVKVLRPPP
jgi:hypothetical protein